ncbi:glutaredoxin family protein [Colwellia sp. 4_MG-2023]|jgi:hypothetical protein|uniref:glutaredoxin family protein n=1 Tax=unclassified Colwellia TaxID=196834 RepID=UPI001C084D12|nr:MULTISPECIES: glutaredoxin family protein [unclassified Colwellia]MBU2926270.1 glutaredoxin family protein [Colwellia sp. C2M11]MDO6489691.1 glutaredoxin family protein [Colwellia sp. 6_MG-2023]MDO6506630.1 glutaredoxin family protein [Colwellia sp. 5_MG-2023]MDO6555117.1 glutaredoxin family protein [Colwellia sp. 4_MG-2023]MDO6654155.1 glutaredoxin family protein [Colwellia sp. 3_MG-2023]
MTIYNLYGSEGCHLCEEALALSLSVIPKAQLNQVDIVDQETVAHESKTLVELYGVHIPVLEKLNPAGKADNQKLFWPFTAEQIIQLLD